MKVKFGDLTVYQAAQICKRPSCTGCPLSDRPLLCIIARYACSTDYNGNLEVEIDLPDKETNDEG